MTYEADLSPSAELADLIPKIRSGQRLSRSDFLRLWKTTDLTSLGILANFRRENVSSNTAYYRPARHVNHTRSPVLSCPGCARHAKNPPGLLSMEELDAVLNSIDPEIVGELHLTGGTDCDLGIADLCRLVNRVREARPKLSLRAFTWSELERASEKDRKDPIDVLGALYRAGVSSLAAGALAQPAPACSRVTKDHLHQLERRVRWIEAAAQMGLACELSWIYGDDDDPEILADTLIRIRELQDQCRVFTCFEPLTLGGPGAAIEIPMPTGYNLLRAIAVGRLFLDNFPRVRGSWWALEESVMQVAQWYGADDSGSASLGICSEDPRLAGPSCERMEELLRATGRIPAVDLAR